MKNIAIIAVLLSKLFLFSSCEKEIELDLKNATSKLILEGNILMGLDTLIQVQELKLTKSVNYTANSTLEPISDAKVSVSDGQNTFTFNHVGNGVYKSNFIAVAGKSYKLVIIYNEEVYEASETIKKGPLIENLSVNYFPSALGSPEGNFITVNTIDPENDRNFYLWRLYINKRLMINPSPGNIYRAIQKDDFFNGQPLFNYLPFDNFPVFSGDTTVMEQLNISEQMYNYYYSIFNITSSSPVSGDVPPGKILGNIVNKTNPNKNALGYFGACSVSIKIRNL